MGIQDFITVFDQLDAAQKGFVTVDQLQTLLETVYDAPITQSVLHAAVIQVCGPGHGGRVERDAFLDVLEEIGRRQSLDEQAYWDFQALDFNASHRIKLRDALTLFQEYHGTAFSLHTWHAFLLSRQDPKSDVFFDEIREWLCGLPSGEPASDREIEDEVSRLEMARWEHFKQDYDDLKQLREGDHRDDEENQYADDTKRHAHRKRHKWDRQGLASMLTDDGLEAEGETTVKLSRRRDAVTFNDLLDVMEVKYSLLLDALVSHMADFAANMDSEKPELVQSIKRSVAKLTKGGKVRDAESIPGASAILPFTLLRLIGDLEPAHLKQVAELENLRPQLQKEGKSDRDIDDLLRKEYDSLTKGSVRCSQALSELMHRRKAEKSLLHEAAHDPVDGGKGLWRPLCRLQRQVVLLRDLPTIAPAALATGLAERQQKYQPETYDCDRDRSEQLAELRLKERRGHKMARTTTQLPDISELQDSGGINIRENVVMEMELRHHLEREALVHMLQGPESGQKKAAGQKMSGEERRRRLIALRGHHLNWKMGNSGDSAPNFTILEEAVGLYWVERQSQLERYQHNVSNATVNAAVLADLQQRQENDFATCLKAIEGKRGEGLITLLKQESRVRYQEQFNNVAFVVLGVVDLSKEDEEFMEALSEKYRAVRDQVFVFALRDRHGHNNWNSMGREGRQSELQKLRKEEKKVRGDGRLVNMANIIGPKSQALPALVHLVGENKEYGTGSKSKVVTKPVNLLADLVPRFDFEQESLLGWLHSEECKTSQSQQPKLRELVCLDLERFIVGVDGDYEVGLTALGLLERIQTVLSGRPKADREKQRWLAEKRVSLRKWRTRQGEPCKIPAEDKTAPVSGDKLSWQRSVLRVMLRRQAMERESLLRILQDPGFGDLVEAAGQMVAEERWQRQAHLGEKYRSLNLATADGQEERMSVLEEAGALRVAGVQAVARRQAGKAMSEDEVSAYLLTELQDVHDTELAEWLQDALDFDEGVLQPKGDMERKSMEEGRCTNILTVLTRVDGDSEAADAFIKLVEEKYLALRESVFLTAVVRQGGERQSQKQRDKQLQRLRKEVSPLWEAGDAEKVAKALGSELVLEHSAVWLFGMERGKFSKQRDTEGSGQAVKEPPSSEDRGMLAAVSHLMQRFTEEKDHLLSSLAGANGQFLSESMKMALKSRLKREKTVIASEEGLLFASLACGLAERQSEDASAVQLENDRERYSLLGQHEFGVRQSGREGHNKKDSLAVDRTENRETLQDAVLNLLQKKHQEERQLLVEMLINPRFEKVQREAAVESDQQRNDRLGVLKAKRQASNLDSSSDNLALLQEALVVLKEIRRGHQGKGSTPADDLDLSCQLMSALLLLQNVEAEQYLGDFPTEEISEMIESQEQILEEFRKNHCVNIAALVFSPDMLQSKDRETDPMQEAIEGKYDALRDRLLMEALMEQMGKDNWMKLSEQERQKRLLDLKLKTMQLQREGKYDELSNLLGDALNNEATLKRLLGDNREDFDRKMKERLEKRRRRLAEGLSEEECDQLEREEEESEEEEARQRRCNVLEGLQMNLDQERDALFRQLQEAGDDAERERQKKLLQLRLEQRRLRRDDDVHSTALLLQQVDELVKNKDSDRLRQERLARERLEAARLRKKDGRSLEDDGQLTVISNALDTETDVLKLQEMALTSLDLKHQSERDLLITLLDEHSSGKEREMAEGMSVAELADRLEELGEVFQELRIHGPQGLSQEGLQLLKEALAYTVELKRKQLESDGRTVTEEGLQVALLADLQQVQDREHSNTLNATVGMDEERLKQLIRSIVKNKEQGCHDNVAQVLLHPAKDKEGREDGGEEEDEGLTEEEREEKRVVKMLEKKYDALRDKMIIEALIKQHGEAEWKRMSDLERQRKLVEMKRKERQLRHEGKMDEVEALLGQHLKHKEDLENILGESAQEQKRRLQERLAKRRQLKADREAQGLEADDATLDAIQDEEEREGDKAKRRNVLENLQMQFEDEKASLLARLNQHSDGVERERERQRAMVQLQRDRQQLEAEDKLDSAALIFSMGQQQHADRQEGLLKERDRQKQLAKERLMQRRRQILDGRQGSLLELLPVVEEDVDIPENVLAEGIRPLQEGVLVALDKHQTAERDTLMQLLARCRRDKETAKQLQNMMDEEVKLKLTKTEKEHVSWRKESAKKVAALSDPRLNAKRRKKLTDKAVQRFQSQIDILGRAMAHKLELERRQLGNLRQEAKEEELWEELCIITLANLQERQMMVFNTMQESVFSKNKEELQTMRKSQKAANQEGWFESLSVLAFNVEDMSGEVISLSDRRNMEAKLQDEFQQQKRAILEKAKHEDLDADAMLKELEDQHAVKRQKLMEDADRQRAELLRRLEARRNRQSDRGFEAEAALQMLQEAQDLNQATREREAAERGSKSSLLQQRVQERREARKKSMMARRDSRMELSPLPSEDSMVRSDSVSMSSLRREKTSINTAVSEDEKQAIYNQLVQQQLRKHSTEVAQRQKQQEALRLRREARKEKREDVAAALFSLGERQKTSLQQAKQGEYERQIAKNRERVSRAKYERTMTRKASLTAMGPGFSDQVEEEGDSSMEEKARQLEQHFKQQAESAKTGSGADGGGAGVLTEKSRMDILKERRKQKKQQRQEKE